MSRNAKIVLGGIAGLLVLCMCVWVAGIGIFVARASGDSSRTEVVRQIDRAVRVPERAAVTYETPAGWKQEFSLHILDMTMSGLTGSDGHSHIFVMQLPAGRDAEGALRDALSTAPTGSTTYGRGMVLKDIGRQTMTIRGQQISMKISEGTNHDGDAYRQMVGVSDDGNGQMLVVIEQPVKTWDAGMVDRFVASIR